MKLRLRFEKSGAIRDVVEFTRGGWPICPGCNEDELAAVRTIQPRTAADVDFCYRCGKVEVLGFEGAEPETAALPGVD